MGKPLRIKKKQNNWTTHKLKYILSSPPPKKTLQAPKAKLKSASTLKKKSCVMSVSTA